MAKKADLLEQAKKLKLEVSGKNTIAEIEAALKSAEDKKNDDKEVVAERKSDVAKAGKRSEKALEEAEAIVAAGGQSVTLGPRILRADTAAVAGLSIVQYEKGDLGS